LNVDRVYTRLFLATLRGEGPKKVLKQCGQNVSNFDAELYAHEKLEAPEEKGNHLN
jgi:hypothetical protein